MPHASEERDPTMPAAIRKPAAALIGLALLALAACSSHPGLPEPSPIGAAQARALTERLLPPGLVDRAGWAIDIDAAFLAMELPVSSANLCAVIAVAEQESGLQADPPVPGLAAIAWKEIDARAAAHDVPLLVVHAALHVVSPDGRTYADRIDAAKTEGDLSASFEDLVGALPLGQTFLADRNPVRTAGSMQVSVAFAEQYAQAHPYPYPVERSLRRELFTRRGGLYFGIAHLLDYPTNYDQPLYRFADFNAGRYASRNAAFQAALGELSGIPLALDGDLVRAGSTASDPPGETELVARVLARRLDLDNGEIRAALERGEAQDFERTRLYQQVFALADRVRGTALPRALLPQIRLKGPKIQRRLTTEWYARRVDERYRRCLQRDAP
jgi:hypothetical protein